MSSTFHEQSRNDVTRLLHAMGAGDAGASGELLPILYQELRAMARSIMTRERAGQTLQPTALVHEAYLRLVGSDVQWNGRRHFLGAAALAMRRLLVERARSRGRFKRGGDRQRVELREDSLASEPPATDLIAVDAVLDKLKDFDRRKYDVVMLRFFAGLSIEQTAEALDVSSATVRNDWTFSRAWLLREIANQAD